MALSHGCRSWVEHTPGAPRQVAALESLVPRLRAVHVVRDGRDEIAAHCLAAADSQSRGCCLSDAHAAIERWNSSLAAHVRCLGRPGHSFVLYEDLVRRPRHELLRLVRELGLNYDVEAAESAVEGIDSGLARAERARLRTLFGRERRQRIEARLDLDRYGAFAEYCRRGRVWEAFSEISQDSTLAVTAAEHE